MGDFNWQIKSSFFSVEGVKINQHVYLEMLKEKLVPWIDAKVGEDGITHQKDGATSHTAILFRNGVKKI